MTAENTWKKIQKICTESTGKDNYYKLEGDLYRIDVIKLKSSMDSAYKEIRASVYQVNKGKMVKPGIHISMLGDVVKYPTIFLKLIKKLRFTEV
jgi:hypothetical protein